LDKDKETRYKTFVTNRVGKILDHLSEDMWQFVMSEENPADLSSREIEVDEKEKWEFYHNAPPFLTWPKNFWTLANVDSSLTDKEESEVRKIKECSAVEMNAELSVFDKLSQNC
jgi:hypothetical protein